MRSAWVTCWRILSSCDCSECTVAHWSLQAHAVHAGLLLYRPSAVLTCVVSGLASSLQGLMLTTVICMQVPVKEREKLLKKEGLDPTRLANLTLVYKVQEVALPGMTSC